MKWREKATNPQETPKHDAIEPNNEKDIEITDFEHDDSHKILSSGPRFLEEYFLNLLQSCLWNNTVDKAVPNRAYTTEMDIFNSLIKNGNDLKITIDKHQGHATSNQIARWCSSWKVNW